MTRIGFLGAIFAAMAAPALSEVTLELGDGSVVLTGELLSAEDGTYEIQTLFGTFSVPVDLAVCTGDCPVFEEPIGTDVRIVSVPPFFERLIPEVLTTYMTATGSALESPAALGALPSGNMLGPDGSLSAVLDTKVGEPDAAFAALLADEADIIFTDRRISQTEIEAFIDAGLGDLSDPQYERIFGGDAATLLVSVVNPVQSLSLEQASGIFSGEITNWSDVGGPDLPINVYVPAEGSAIADMFENSVLLPNFAFYGGDINRTQRAEDVAAAVASDPFGIGVTKYSFANDGRTLPITASCGIQHIPTRFSVAAEDYPLTSRFYAYTTNRPAPDMVAQLSSLMQSDPGQIAVESSGFLNLSTQEADLNSFGQRLAYALSSRELQAEIPNLSAFAREVVDADRLSTTFRFDTGSSQLDNKALADVLRLADLLAEPQYAGAEIMLIGFTDSIGATEVNKVLSERRAGQVFDEVSALAGDLLEGTSITTLGFGAANPVDCNDTADGRELNRRVEVWIR